TGGGAVYLGSFRRCHLPFHAAAHHNSKSLPRFPGFVYQHARFSSDHMSIEIAVRPRKGSKAICSRCHLPASGYDQLAERRFEFIPFRGFWFFCGTPCSEAIAAAARRWWSRKFPGPTANERSPGRTCCFCPLGAQTVVEGNGRGVSHFLG